MRKVNCPECKSPSEWSKENKHRPFCSARCQLLDLGAWASENHRIAGDPVIDSEEEYDGIEH
jgi:endogenous inhibitor of DNA gyrase (YacG/DUF329 family)